MNLFLRYASLTTSLPNNFTVKAYDDRILYIVSGEGKILLEGVEYAISAGSFCYYPAGTSYFPISSKENPLKFVTLNFDFNRDNESQKTTVSPVRREAYDETKQLTKDGRIYPDFFKRSFVIQNLHFYKNDFLNTASIFQKNGEFSHEAAASILQSVLYRLMERPEKSYGKITSGVIEFVAENYMKIKSAKDVSAALKYHEYYITKILKEELGVSLYEYILQVRMQKAAEILLNGGASVKETAFLVGFQNENHFSKRFHDYFGMTPTEYKEKFLTDFII